MNDHERIDLLEELLAEANARVALLEEQTEGFQGVLDALAGEPLDWGADR